MPDFFSSNPIKVINETNDTLVILGIFGNMSVVGPGVFYQDTSKTFFVSDQDMLSDPSRYGITQTWEGFKLTNPQLKTIHLKEAIYLGSGMDFLFYEATVYSIAKISSLLSKKIREPYTVILNSTMQFNMRIFIESYIQRKFPHTTFILASKEIILNVSLLQIFSLNSTCLDASMDSLKAAAADMRPINEIDLPVFPTAVLFKREQGLFFRRKMRKPTNYKFFELVAKLKGFKVLDPALLPVETMIQMCSRAKLIVSYHSGALVHTLWCHPGTTIREVHGSWMDPCFQSIARASELNYEAYPYKSKGRIQILRTIGARFFRDDKKLRRSSNWRIPVRDFRKILSKTI